MSNTDPAGTAGGSPHPSKETPLVEALQLMQRALTLVDEAEGPADVGAHLDLAIARLTEWIETGA